MMEKHKSFLHAPPFSPWFKTNLRKLRILLCNIKNKNCFLRNFIIMISGDQNTPITDKHRSTCPEIKTVQLDKEQWAYQTQSGNFLASIFKLPTLLPSWTNTAFGKVKPVRSSSESPWVNYNMWWWHSCVFWKQQGEVRVGHYKPLAFTTGCKRQWGQEASHRDQGAQSPAKNKQAPRVTSAGKYHWSLNSQVPKQREENVLVQQAPKGSQNNHRDWQGLLFVLKL